MRSDPFPGGIETLAGYISALPVPFHNGAVDEKTFATFCEWQINKGIAGLVVNGTTGEAPALSDEEQFLLVRRAVLASAGRVPVIAGTGSNATAHAMSLARDAEVACADGLLIVTPYYNRPSQEGLYRHYRAIHDTTRLPIILYEVPSRTSSAFSFETLGRLSKLPRIVGLKDATGNPDRALRLRALLGERFRLFSGDDATALDFIANGGNGCVSVLSNVIPDACVRMFKQWSAGRPDAARALERSFVPLIGALFAESNPVPLKHALSVLGHMAAEVRLPLCEAADNTRAEIELALSNDGRFTDSSGKHLATLATPARTLPKAHHPHVDFF